MWVSPPTHSVNTVLIRSPNNHTNKEKNPALILLFHLGLCKVLLFYLRLWLCGFCPGGPLRSCETGEISSLGPSEATANSSANGLDWTVMHGVQCATGAVDYKVEYILDFKSWFGNSLLFNAVFPLLWAGQNICHVSLRFFICLFVCLFMKSSEIRGPVVTANKREYSLKQMSADILN